MPAPPRPDSILQEAIDAMDACGTKTLAAQKLGIPRTTLQERLREAMAKGFEPRGTMEKPVREFEFPTLPDKDIDIEALVAHRIRQFQQRKCYEDARRLIKVRVTIPGPIAIWHFGDPHIDDDGTDLAAIKRDTETIRTTPGLFGANVGDTTNNWTGRLARLWAQQSTSHKQAWALAEWFIRRVDWLYLIGGNHDAWSGDGDPLTWIQRGGSAPYMSSEVRLELTFPNGNTCRINARHDFSGHSQYNPVHGPMKATMFGVRDHIAVAGHKHIGGHGVLKNPDDGSLCHSYLVAGYKVFDRYALEKGFRDQHISPGVLTIINPSLANTHQDFVSHYFNLEYGVRIFNLIRKDWLSQQKHT